MSTPIAFFNANFHFNLGEGPNKGNPFRTIDVRNCFFMKRNGTFVNSIDELDLFLDDYENESKDLLIVRCVQKRNCEIPNVENFNNYPELLNPDNRTTEINENTPYKITSTTKGELENKVTINVAGKHKKKSSTKKRKSKSLRHKKRRSSRKY